jgi:hypothetical protein
LVQKKSEVKTRNRKENTYWIGSSSCVTARGYPRKAPKSHVPFFIHLYAMARAKLDTHLCEGEAILMSYIYWFFIA